MSIADEDQARIEQYLQGRMSPEERATFEADCAQRPALAEALMQERELRTLARAVRLVTLQEEIARAARARRNRPRVWGALTAAAAAAAIFLVVYFAWMRPPSYRSFALELVADAAEKGDGQDSLAQTQFLLQQGKPQDALRLLRDMGARGQYPHKVDYFMALAFALDQSPDSSRHYLKQFIAAYPEDNHRADADSLLKLLP